MANAAGGRIFYGVIEDRTTGVAELLDDGLAPDEVTADQIGNLLTGNIEPAISGVRIQRIALANGNNAFAIDVPQATTLAPHQSRPDRVYYRRHDRKVLPMYDHEIKDIMRRGDKPRVDPRIRLLPTDDPSIFRMQVEFLNSTEIPILYYSLDVLLERTITVLHPIAHCETINTPISIGDASVMGVAYQRNFVTPYAIPLFKPRLVMLWEGRVEVSEGYRHGVAVSFTAPGFHAYWSGHIDRSTPVTKITLKLDL
jgi:hypothetical protein